MYFSSTNRFQLRETNANLMLFISQPLSSVDHCQTVDVSGYYARKVSEFLRYLSVLYDDVTGEFVRLLTASHHS